jgi:hypothetical protein
MCLRAELCEGKGINRGAHNLCAAVINEVNLGIELICELDDLTFRKQANGTGTIGEQFRHNLDFLNVFLKGIRIGRIDYGNRQRNERVAKDRYYAAEQFEEVVFGFEHLRRADLQTSVSVMSEIDEDVWLISSALREMEFVYSHTVHHHALIAEKLAGFGISIREDFGVSRSTMTYWQRAA